jgi:hypothetical protein
MKFMLLAILRLLQAPPLFRRRYLLTISMQASWMPLRGPCRRSSPLKRAFLIPRTRSDCIRLRQMETTTGQRCPAKHGAFAPANRDGH